MLTKLNKKKKKDSLLPFTECEEGPQPAGTSHLQIRTCHSPSLNFLGHIKVGTPLQVYSDIQIIVLAGKVIFEILV